MYMYVLCVYIERRVVLSFQYILSCSCDPPLQNSFQCNLLTINIASVVNCNVNIVFPCTLG